MHADTGSCPRFWSTTPSRSASPGRVHAAAAAAAKQQQLNGGGLGLGYREPTPRIAQSIFLKNVSACMILGCGFFMKPIRRATNALCPFLLAFDQIVKCLRMLVLTTCV